MLGRHSSPPSSCSWRSSICGSWCSRCSCGPARSASRPSETRWRRRSSRQRSPPTRASTTASSRRVCCGARSIPSPGGPADHRVLPGLRRRGRRLRGDHGVEADLLAAGPAGPRGPRPRMVGMKTRMRPHARASRARRVPGVAREAPRQRHRTVRPLCKGPRAQGVDLSPGARRGALHGLDRRRAAQRGRGELQRAFHSSQTQERLEHGQHQALPRAPVRGTRPPAGLQAFETGVKSQYSFESRPGRSSPAYLRRFRSNAPAWAFFEAQPPGYRRTCCFWVMSAKKPETRERRLALLISRSARGEGIPRRKRPWSKPEPGSEHEDPEGIQS